MNTLSKCWNFIRRHVNKYQIVFIFFLIMILFVDEHNVFRRMGYKRKINELKTEIGKFGYERDSCKNESDNLLRRDNDNVERIAREEYGMKKNDEDVFVIQNKEKSDE